MSVSLQIIQAINISEPIFFVVALLAKRIQCLKVNVD